MSGTYSLYPESLDNTTSLPLATDNITPVTAEVVNRLRDALICVENELGVNPSGIYSTVRARLDALETTGGGGGGGGSGFIDIQKNGVDILSLTSIIDFIGNVTITNPSPYKVQIDVGGAIAINNEGVEIIPSASTLDFVGNVIVTNPSASTIQIDVPGATQVQETKTLVDGQTSFTLSSTPVQSGAVIMFINGLKQTYGTDYTVSSTTVNWIGSDVLQSTDKVEFWYLHYTGAISTATGSAGGDLSLTYPDPNVIGLTHVTSDLIFNQGTSPTIRPATPTSTGAGLDLTIRAGQRNTSGAGGILRLNSGGVTGVTSSVNIGDDGYSNVNIGSATGNHDTNVYGAFFWPQTASTIIGTGPTQTFEVDARFQGRLEMQNSTTPAGISAWAGYFYAESNELKWKDTNGLVTKLNGAFTVTAVKTTTYTAAIGELVLCDVSGAGFTVNLPTAVGAAGKKIAIKKINSSTNTLTVDGNGSETIDGNLTTTLTNGFQSITLVSDGTNWIDYGASSASSSVTGLISKIAGEAINIGELVCIDNSAGVPRIFKADANGAGNLSNVVGVASSTVSLGGTFNVQISGEKLIPDTEWDVVPTTSDVGKKVYLSETAGNWTLTAPTTAGSYVLKCGVVTVGGTGAVTVLMQIGNAILL